MKITKVLPFIVAVSMLFLSACSGISLTFASPATGIAALQSVVANAPAASAPVAGSLPVANAQVASSPQTIAGIDALQNAYETVYQNVNPSVVTIMISSPVSAGGGFGRQGNSQGSQGQIVPTAEGSGFVWDSAGHIVTNNHVVEGASKITVTFADGSTFDAKLVGTDPNTDLAVIQVTGAPASLLKPITMGDSTQVKVGQMVVAIGNPYGLANTMTTGIVSAISRTIPATANSQGQNGQGSTGTGASFSIPDVIQTDAAINPGNSGGVLVNMDGQLIGVPSQIESASGSNSGVGFAIPSAIVNRVAPQLISKGKAAHAFLGISGGTITADTISLLNLKDGQQGVLVATVVSGGPAASAGLQAAPVDANGTPTAAGDIITGIDGKTITRMDELISYLQSNTQPGQTVTLNVLRGGKDITVKVTLGTQPTN
jgi:serine protease Do